MSGKISFHAFLQQKDADKFLMKLAQIIHLKLNEDYEAEQIYSHLHEEITNGIFTKLHDWHIYTNYVEKQKMDKNTLFTKLHHFWKIVTELPQQNDSKQNDEEQEDQEAKNLKERFNLYLRCEKAASFHSDLMRLLYDDYQIEPDPLILYKELIKMYAGVVYDMEFYEPFLDYVKNKKLNNLYLIQQLSTAYDEFVHGTLLYQEWKKYNEASSKYDFFKGTRFDKNIIRNNNILLKTFPEASKILFSTATVVQENFSELDPSNFIGIFNPLKLYIIFKWKIQNEFFEDLRNEEFLDSLTKENLIKELQGMLKFITKKQFIEFWSKEKCLKSFKFPSFTNTYIDSTISPKKVPLKSLKIVDEENPTQTFKGISKSRNQKQKEKVDLYELPDTDSDEDDPPPSSSKNSQKARTKQKTTKTVVRKNSQKASSKKQKEENEEQEPEQIPVYDDVSPDHPIPLCIVGKNQKINPQPILEDEFILHCTYDNKRIDLKPKREDKQKYFVIRFVETMDDEKTYLISNKLSFPTVGLKNKRSFICSSPSIWFGQFSRPILALDHIKNIKKFDSKKDDECAMNQATYEGLKIAIPHIKNQKLLQIAFCYASSLYNIFESESDPESNWGLDLLTDIKSHRLCTFEMAMQYLSIYYSSALTARSICIEHYATATKIRDEWKGNIEDLPNKKEFDQAMNEGSWWEDLTISLAKTAIQYGKSLLDASGQKFKRPPWNKDPFKEYIPKYFIHDYCVDEDHLQAESRFFLTANEVQTFNEKFNQVMETLSAMLKQEFSLTEQQHPCFKTFIEHEDPCYYAEQQPSDDESYRQMHEILDLLKQNMINDDTFYPDNLFSPIMIQFLEQQGINSISNKSKIGLKLIHELQEYADVNVVLQPLWSTSQSMIKFNEVRFTVPSTLALKNDQPQTPPYVPERSHSPPRISSKRPNRAASGKTHLVTSSVQAPLPSSASQPIDPKEVEFTEEEISENFDL